MQLSREVTTPLKAAAIAVLVCAAIALHAVFGQEWEPATDKAAVIFSPGYFDCKPCKAEERYLKRLGADVYVIKIHSDAAAENLGIESYPTTVVGRKVVGFGPDEMAIIRGELER